MFLHCVVQGRLVLHIFSIHSRTVPARCATEKCHVGNNEHMHILHKTALHCVVQGRLVLHTFSIQSRTVPARCANKKKLFWQHSAHSQAPCLQDEALRNLATSYRCQWANKHLSSIKVVFFLILFFIIKTPRNKKK